MLLTVYSAFVSDIHAEEPIKPIPEKVEVNAEKLPLGRTLFYDPRLSKGQHPLMPHVPQSRSRWRRRPRNCHRDRGAVRARQHTHCVQLRFQLQAVLGRGGRIPSKTRSVSMCSRRSIWEGLWPEVVSKLYQHESYPRRFKALYPDGITRREHHERARRICQVSYHPEQSLRPVPEGR